MSDYVTTALAELSEAELRVLTRNFAAKNQVWAEHGSRRVALLWHSLTVACAEESDRRRHVLQACADDLEDGPTSGCLVPDGAALAAMLEDARRELRGEA